MNPGAQLATALLPHMDPAIAGLLGTIGFLAGLFATAVVIALAICGPDEEVQP